MRNPIGRGILATCLVILLATAASAASKGNLRYSINVTTFKNEAGWHGKWSVGDGFKTMLTDSLQESSQFIVLGGDEMRGAAMKEQDFAASGRAAGGKKAPATGQMTPAQLLVRGSVTHVQESTTGGRGGVSFRGIRVGGSGDKAEVNITIYLVDSSTGQVKASTKVVGTSGKKGLSVGYHGSKLGGLRGDLAGFKKDNVGKACQDAVDQSVKFLVDQLDEIPWEGTVVLAKGDTIIVNRGTREGVDVGTSFAVGEVEPIVDPDTGEVLDSELTEVATLEVTKVKEKIAYCKVLSGEGVEKGMSVFPR